jgi:epoxyqueuosine reductase
MPDNPFGGEHRKRLKARTGCSSLVEVQEYLPYEELAPADRIGQSLEKTSWRLVREYHPTTVEPTAPEGRLKITDTAWMSRFIKKIAMFFGAEMVFITRVDPRWVYANLEIDHQYVIMVVVTHFRGLNDTAPSHLAGAAAGDTYSRLKFIASRLADFIAGLGYEAAYRETLATDEPEMLVVPTAIDAGVGEFARSGHCLSPEFGINMRMKPVTTNLPLQVDSPVSFNIHDFCTVCENCANYCPANAIPRGAPAGPVDIYNNTGFQKWYISGERCLRFWAANKGGWTSCSGRCLAVCPWNKPLNPFHNTVRWLAIHSPNWFRRLLVWADRKLYHRTRKLRQNI